MFAMCLYGVALCRAQGIITTFAGSDITYPGAPFPANSASFGQLISTAVGPDGGVYFVSESRALVLKLNPSTSAVTVVAGIGINGYSGDGGPANKAELNNPQGIAFDSAGTLYVADNGNGVVRKIDSSGTITTYAKAPYVVGLTFASDGSLYASNYYQILHINADGSSTAVAGGTGQGYKGDGGPATAALLSDVSGIIFDQSHNLLLADSGNNRIRRIDTTGKITTIAGNGQGGASVAGPAASTAIGFPIGLALDGYGNLYTGSYSNNQLLKIDTTGQLSILNPNASTFFLTAPGPVAKAVITPAWPALDSAGNLYVVDSFAGCLWQVSATGTIQVAAGFAPNFFLGDNGPAALAGLNGPSGIWMAADGSLLVAEQANNRIRRISSAGTITTVVGNGAAGMASPGPALSSPLEIPVSVTSDGSGNIYLLSSGIVFRANPAGVLSLFYQGSSGANAVATDAQGNVLVASAGNQIVRVTPAGIATVIAGTGQAGFSGDGGPATSAVLNGPFGVAADSAGNVYFSDTYNGRIRKIAANGNISTIGGGGSNEVDGVPATQSAAAPDQLTVDKAGNVYFVEYYNDRVREISSTGIISTIAGTGAPGFSGDGGLATSAMINGPSGVAIDSAGNIYISDRLNGRIREILAAPVSMTVSSNQLTMTAPSSGAPAQGSIIVGSSVQGLGYSLSVSTQTGGSWLSLSSTQGQATSSFSIIADPSNLTPNTYQGTVTIANPRAVPPTQNISVTFQVTAAVPAKLAAGNGPLSFALTAGAAAATAQLAVSNQGGGTLSFTAAAATSSGGSWLQVSPASGSALSSAPASLTVTATPGALAAGTYSGSIAVTSATTGESITVSVTLAISAVPQSLLLSQTGFTFTTVAQGGSPLPQNFGILNTGGGTMTWSASATTLSGTSWLSIDQNSGTVATPNTGVSTVNVSVNPSGLAAGSYYGQVQVSAPGAPNSPQTVSIVLNVLPAGSGLAADVQPTGLIFIGQAGSSPGAQTVMISNPQPGAITFGGSFFTVPTGGHWVRFLPANASVQPNAPVAVLVQPDYTNLASGQYQGFVSLGFADGSSRSVHVLAVVSPSPSSSGGIVAQASGSCSPIAVQPATLTDPSASVTVGVAVSLQVRAVDNCGNLLTSSNGSVAATFSDGDAAVNLTATGNGYWSGTWTPRSVTQPRVTVEYVALSVSGVTAIGGTATLTVPVISAGASAPLTLGARNSASGAAAYISPGGLVSIYGAGLADSTVTSSTLPFPTQAGGAEVLLGGQPLPLRYVGGNQVNAQVPFGLNINTTQQLVVQRGTTLSVPQNVLVAPAQPGIYTQDQSGSGPGIIVDNSTNTLITAGNPARAGDIVVIYCNGLGAVNPPVPTGTPAPSTEPLARTVNPVTVTIGGLNAPVLFAGLAPGFPDLYQINAQLPPAIASGQMPIVLTVAGQTSPAVTIAIK